MREVKFRLWNNIQDKMLPHKDIDFNFLFDGDDHNDFNLMQYTGLKDKNGKEIYEGDVVAEENKDSEDNIYVCEFDNTDAKFIFCSPLDGEALEENNFASDLKIIGNIYSSPELLK